MSHTLTVVSFSKKKKKKKSAEQLCRLGVAYLEEIRTGLFSKGCIYLQLGFLFSPFFACLFFIIWSVVFVRAWWFVFPELIKRENICLRIYRKMTKLHSGTSSASSLKSLVVNTSGMILRIVHRPVLSAALARLPPTIS